MPSRSLNYTQRKDLKRHHFSVSLAAKVEGKPRTFNVIFNLPDTLDRDARVFVEAYRSSPAARMRFDFGTVDAIVPPPDRSLTEFDDDLPPPLFRAKVTDTKDRPGRLLADISQVRPIDPNADDRRAGLLPIGRKPLNGPVWEIDFEHGSERPTLWIDTTADPHRDLEKRDFFPALVYPEVLRQTLRYVLIENTDAAEEGEWGHAWLDLAKNLPDMRGRDLPLHDDNDAVDRIEWIDEAARAFARNYSLNDPNRLGIPIEGDDA